VVPANASLLKRFAQQRHFSYSVEYSNDNNDDGAACDELLAFIQPGVVIVDRPENDVADADEEDGFRLIPNDY